MEKLTIIGKKNVGKSSLFNLLTKTKKALISSYEGYTRDYNNKITKINSCVCEIIDTAGIGYEKSDLNILSLKQTWSIIKNSTIILYLFDINKEINFIDINIINIIKKLKKKIIYIINKIDCLNDQELYTLTHFHKLKQPIFISIKQKTGIQTLLLAIENKLISQQKNKLNTKIYHKITILGRPNVGKSSFINKIIKKNRMIIHDKPGTTRDSIHINFIYKKNYYTLIDTAGIRQKKNTLKNIEQLSVKESIKSIKNSNTLILIIDIKENITKQDLRLLHYATNIGKPIILIVNKTDLFSKNLLYNIEKKLINKLKFIKSLTYHFISAKYGFGLTTVFNKLSLLYTSQNLNYSSTSLTNLLKNFTSKHSHRKNTKFFYAKIKTHEPLTINIFANKLNNISENYKRYITRSYIEQLNITNIPIKIKFNTIKNFNML